MRWPELDWRAKSWGSLIDSAERYKSTVEIYRRPGNRYEREPVPYNMADPFEMAAWIATLVYSRTFGPTRQDGEEGHEEWPSTWELEQDLRDLAANARAALGDSTAEKLYSREAITTAFAVLGALFPAEEFPAEDRADGDSAGAYGSASSSRPALGPDVPADLWSATTGWPQPLEEPTDQTEPDVGSAGEGQSAAPEPGGGSGGEDGEVGQEPEHTGGVGELERALLGRPLATVVYMARLAFGQTVTQSEAARRLGVSPARVNALVAQGRFAHLRVGRTVLLVAEEVSLGLADRRSARGR